MAPQFQTQMQGQLPFTRALREELDTANKKVDRYVNLVAMLSEELDNLRRGICHNCKEKFVPSYAPRPLPLVGGSQTHSPSSGLSLVLPQNARGSPTTSVPVDPVTANQEKAAILAPPQASASTTPTRPSATPIVKTQSKPDWSVTHNPEIKQALHVDLVRTFNFTTQV